MNGKFFHSKFAFVRLLINAPMAFGDVYDDNNQNLIETIQTFHPLSFSSNQIKNLNEKTTYLKNN